MKQTGHRSVTVVRRYIRDAELFDDNATTMRRLESAFDLGRQSERLVSSVKLTGEQHDFTVKGPSSSPMKAGAGSCCSLGSRPDRTVTGGGVENMQTRCLFVALLPLGCNANEADVSARPSSLAECPTGGTTLLIGDDVHPVCNALESRDRLDLQAREEPTAQGGHRARWARMARQRIRPRLG